MWWKKKESAGIPLSLFKDRAGGPLQKNFSYIFLSMLQQTEQLLLSFIMGSGYLKKETAIQDWSEDAISFVTPAVTDYFVLPFVLPFLETVLSPNK